MRCYSCSVFSLAIFCKLCKQKLFSTEINTRKIATLDVISFYKYTTIEAFLLTKHTAVGVRIYKALAQMTMKPFIEEFTESDERIVYIIGIDEFIKDGYSHISLLTRAMKTQTSLPLHASLMAMNRVRYAGKSLEYRLQNSREFTYKGKGNIDAILVDDIVTTGLTLQEAHRVLSENGVNVLFALVLADVWEG